MLFSVEFSVCLNRNKYIFFTFSWVIILPLSTHTHFPQTAQYPASSRDVHYGLLFFKSHIHNMHNGIFCLVSNISICVGLECPALIRFSLDLVAQGNYALQTSVQVYPFPVYCECWAVKQSPLWRGVLLSCSPLGLQDFITAPFFQPSVTFYCSPPLCSTQTDSDLVHPFLLLGPGI